jgi:hypothetical protein
MSSFFSIQLGMFLSIHLSSLFGAHTSACFISAFTLACFKHSTPCVIKDLPSHVFCIHISSIHPPRMHYIGFFFRRGGGHFVV